MSNQESIPSPKCICRIVTKETWEMVQRERKNIPLNTLDIQDGFVHLSIIEQVLETLNRYFTREQKPKILVLKEEQLQDALRWEVVPHRDNQMFPHLYRQLQFEDILGVWDVQYQPQKRFILASYRKIEDSFGKVEKLNK